MTAFAVGAGLLAGSAAMLAVPVPVPVPVSARRLRSRSRGQATDDRAVLVRLRPLLAGLAGVGAWLFVGGSAGVPAGAVGAVAAWRALAAAEGPATKRRRDELERDLPTAVHLLGACLAAGSATSPALDAVAAALPGAVAEELTLIRRRLALGVDPLTVWRDVGEHPQLRPLGRAMVRAHRSGAAVGAAVDALAAELVAQSRARTDALARSVEVRAAAPLGLCFLPAFVLIGVVPLVVGEFAAMSMFG